MKHEAGTSSQSTLVVGGTTTVDGGDIDIQVHPGQFPSDERIATVEAPVLMYHGTEDTLVPFRQGERLAAAARRSSSVEFIPVEGAGHNDVSETLGRAYFAKVRSFIEGIEE